MNQHEDALKSVKQFKSIVEKMDELMKNVDQVQNDIKEELIKVSNLDKVAASIDKHLEDAKNGLKESSLGMLQVVTTTKSSMDETIILFGEHINELKNYHNDLMEVIKKGTNQNSTDINNGITKLSEKISEFLSILDKLDKQNQLVEELDNSNKKNQTLIIILIAISIILGITGLII